MNNSGNLLSSAKLALSIRQLRSNIDANLLECEPVAIIGIGCRFPGGVESADDYWRLMCDGVDAIGDVPADRWSASEYYAADVAAPGKMNGRWGGFLPGVDLFDPMFFGIAPREAVNMDPQQRLALEVAWEALWDSGRAPEQIAGSRTGVFVAIYNTDYSRLLLNDEGGINSHTCAGAANSMASGRIAYLLDLHGPAVSVDTACSSSLVSVHLAVQSLRTRDCDMAIAGGVSVKLTPEHYLCLSKLAMLSPDGRCHTFDAAANGFVPGEGCGLVVLKRLSDALADGDRIRAVIRGSALNQDGRTNSLTAPNGLAQQRVIRAAISNARVQPSDIGYVETHGTGTALGDPIEVEALAETIGQGSEPCVLGAVKSNFGHLEAAAGIAGLIKTALVLEKEEIPSNLHFRELNPHISLEGTRFELATERKPWKRGAKPRLAGVSSFGFTGTNAHLILEEPPRLPVASDAGPAPALPVLAISARTPQALESYAARYAEYLSGAGSFDSPAEICRAAAQRRAHYEERIAVTGSTHEELRVRLLEAASGATSLGVARGRAVEGAPVAFVFSGQGSQWARMGVQLMADEPVFRRSIEAFDALVRECAGWSLIDILQANEAESLLNRTEYAQPAIVAVEIALAELWKSWGITPAAVLGHSVGEIAAAHVAGVLDLQTAVRVAVKRGRMMDAATGHGRMATVALTAAAVETELSGTDGSVSIAAVNGPTSTVISGDPEQVERLFQSWQARGISARMLPVDYAFHSAQMAPFRTALPRELGHVPLHEAQVPLLSTVTGAEAGAGDYSADYWGRNVRQPVLFAFALERALARGVRCFLEIGPHAVLNSAIGECVADLGVGVVSSLRKGRDERTALMAAVAQLYTLGQPVDWKAVLGASRTPVPLPTYPYQRRRYWISTQRAIAHSDAPVERNPRPFAGERLQSPALEGAVWQTTISAADRRVSDHRIAGTVVFPLAGFIELICSAIACGEQGITLEDLHIEQALQLRSDPVVVQTVLKGGNVEVFSLTHGEWTRHVRAKYSTGVTASEASVLPAASGETGEFYTRMNNAGLEYGPGYRTVRALDAKDGEALSTVSVEDDASSYVLHPALLDGCLQTFVAARGSDGNLYMPTHLERLEVYRRGAPEARCQLTAAADGTTADFVLAATTGELVALGRGLRLRRIRSGQTAYELRWDLREREAAGTAPSGRIAVVGGGASVLQALERRGVTSSASLEGAWSVVYVAGEDAGREWLELIQKTAAQGTELWLITRNAQRAQQADLCAGFAQQALWAVARTAALEYPDLCCRRVDLDDSPDSEAALIDELLSPGEEFEIAFRGGNRYAASVARLLTEQQSGPRRLVISERGSLSCLAFEEAERRDPHAGEVEVEVLATALNFRDVMNALGAYLGDPGPLGLEFCGRVLRTGDGVANCRAGDLVMGVGWGAFTDVFTANASLLCRVPSGLDAESAVTLPNAFATAYHCLAHVARLRSGERVLIHSAAGGVGLMAVQIALNVGAEVFATAGSDEKRAYLRSLGVQHVFNSRTLDFSSGVLDATAGAGVDVVLNSLSGDFIAATMAALAEGGRFVEIGKTGIWDAGRVSALGRRIEYSVVDIGVFLDGSHEVVGGYLEELRRRVETGAIAPLPKHTFEFAEAEQAFRFMAQAKHTGKIVLRHTDAGGFRTDGKWFLTGGLGALGLETAKWLVSRGASALVMAGRRAPDASAAAVIEELRHAGVIVEYQSLDVADPEQVQAALAATGPLTGIVHLAGVLDDGVLEHQTWERFEQVWRAKASGAWNLHQAAKDVQHFILFSSAASLLGSPGQGNYAAANAYLDGLANWRSAQGLSALSVQWGAWQDGGMAARVEASGRRRTMSLLRPMPSSECLEMLDAVIGKRSNAAILSADWEQWHAMPGRSRTAVSVGGGARVEQSAPATRSSIAETLAVLPPARKRKAALDFVRGQAARILGLGETYPIGEHEPLMKLGLDSLMALEMRNTLAQAFGRAFSSTLLFDHPTLGALVDLLVGSEATNAAPAPEPVRDQLLEEISAMSDEEAEQLLAKELSAGSGS